MRVPPWKFVTSYTACDLATAGMETDKRRRGEDPGIKRDQATRPTYHHPPVGTKESVEGG